MHQTSDPIVARFTFTPERAGEFLDDPLRLVTQIDCESVDEVMEYLHQFGDAIADCSAIVNGQVVNLSEQPEKE